jgi:hypothetical protein
MGEMSDVSGLGSRMEEMNKQLLGRIQISVEQLKT